MLTMMEQVEQQAEKFSRLALKARLSHDYAAEKEYTEKLNKE